MSEPLISVVVPVYKAERYLDRCVESLLAQTHTHLEILLIEDGSPDGSGALCDAWAAREERVRAFHKENGGPSAARNFGVDRSEGDYVSFVDADDYVAPDYLEYLLRLLTGNGADIACAQYRVAHDGDERFEPQGEDSVRRFTSGEAILALYGQELYMPLVTAWAKLFKREIVREVRFPEGRLHEDDATAYRFYYRSALTVLGPRAVYAYFQDNADSIVHNRSDSTQEDALLAFTEQCAFFEEHGEPELLRAARDNLLNIAVDLADKGDSVLRSFLRDGRAKAYMGGDLRVKTKVRYYGYRLLGVDLNKLYHKILG